MGVLRGWFLSRAARIEVARADMRAVRLAIYIMKSTPGQQALDFATAWLEGKRQALRRSAFPEAIAHLRNALCLRSLGPCCRTASETHHGSDRGQHPIGVIPVPVASRNNPKLLRLDCEARGRGAPLKQELQMKTILISGPTVVFCALLATTLTSAQKAGAGALIEGYGPSSVIVCDDSGECWHSLQRYNYPQGVQVEVHPYDWKWSGGQHYGWREHPGRGYWRRGEWVGF
jgi:hypothetical protein